MNKTVLLIAFALCAGTQVKAQNPFGFQHYGEAGAATARPQQASASENSIAKITFFEPDNTHDFGTIPEGPDVTYEFKFHNTGKAPLIISNANANCGCTSPIFSKEPILPGEKGTISVTYHTENHPGNFEKFVYVTSNSDGQSQVQLRIKGIVLRKQQ
ncbi:DUF1573 domain-containing protein [Rurimicrobium arvi]|uniref:DUF1573 domain-containing protein n=1 Tax=Rurimicrobium arvi TaxID=2049916 RepID=A0ABP8MFA3_9BACT